MYVYVFMYLTSRDVIAKRTKPKTVFVSPGPMPIHTERVFSDSGGNGGGDDDDGGGDAPERNIQAPCSPTPYCLSRRLLPAVRVVQNGLSSMAKRSMELMKTMTSVFPLPTYVHAYIAYNFYDVI
jgi:hypothetical protein